MNATRLDSARHLLPLAWPVFIGQVAVLAFATIDTLLAARYAAVDLAALAVGGAVYMTVFVGLMGVVMAVGPLTGQLFGAGRLTDCGDQLVQAMWLALGASVLGCAALTWPGPLLDLARTEPLVAEKVRAHLHALAFALPPALMFTAFRGFSIAVSRPKVVMALQVGALFLKAPLTALMVFGARWTTPWGEFQVPAHGAPGCGMATAMVMTTQFLAAWWLLRRDPFYRRFAIGRGRRGIDLQRQAALLHLGLPMGGSVAIEVTAFTFMAIFIARLGATPVAGHQLAMNLVSLMFMLPMSLGSASGVLVAQRIGAGAHAQAGRLAWHTLEIGLLVAASLGAAVYLLRRPILGLYTDADVVIAAASPLLAWVVVFHIADAAQTIAAFILRAYRVATVPMVIYMVALWGVGLGGGYILAFNAGGAVPARLQGAPGFWAASTAGLVVAGVGLSSFLAWIVRQRRGQV